MSRPPFEDGGGWRERCSREVRAELEDHLERRVAALVASGLAPEAARLEAMRRMGDMRRIEEDCMRVAERQRARSRAARWLDDGARDARIAIRTIRRRPVLSAGVILTISLAIAAATSVFGIVRGVLLAPLDYPRAHELFSVYTRYLPETGYDFEYFAISGPELVDYRETTRAMSGVAAFGAGFVNMTPDGVEPERVRVVQATPNLFEVLGIGASLGRVFAAPDGEPAAPCVAVLADGLWNDRFGADPAIAGRDLRLNGTPCTVVGVLPPGAAFPDEATRIYTALRLDPSSPQWERESHSLSAVARLAPGATRAAAELELESLRARWSEDFPDHHARGHFIVLRPLADDVVGDVRAPLLVLLGAVGLVLLVVIVNVAGLIVAGAEARRREFAVRAALGVGRARLIRQLLTESVLLAAIGGVVGIIASSWMLRALIGLYPGRLPRIGEVRLDAVVLAVSAGIALATGMLIGAFPAFRLSAVRLSEVLRAAGRGMSAHRDSVRIRRVFVVAQTALALMLALGAALLVRSYAQLRAVELGFDPIRVLTFSVAAPPGSYPEDARARAYFVRLESRLRDLPGVVAVGAVSDLPLRSGGGADDFIIEGRALPAPGQPAWNARYQMATPGALDALGLQLLSGRWFQSMDVAGTPPVAVINRATARAYFSGEDPIGTRIRYYGSDSTWITIVGVVADVRQLGVTQEPPPAVYAALAQAPRPFYAGRLMNLLVRLQADPASSVDRVRAAAAEVDATLPLTQVTTLDDVVAESLGDRRFTTTLMSAFAVLALLLGAIGVYGVLAHTVSLRANEIGVRLALGADRRSVLAMVVGQGIALVLAGAAIGILATLGLRRVFEGLLYGIRPFDPLSLAFAIGTLLVISLAACCIPAWRAARLDPLTALRAE